MRLGLQVVTSIDHSPGTLGLEAETSIDHCPGTLGLEVEKSIDHCLGTLGLEAEKPIDHSPGTLGLEAETSIDRCTATFSMYHHYSHILVRSKIVNVRICPSVSLCLFFRLSVVILLIRKPLKDAYEI